MSPMGHCAGAENPVDVALGAGEPADHQLFKELKMKRIATLSFTLGFAFALVQSAAAQVKFGVGGPITGPNAATGAQMKNGVEQAATDINAAGGILGKKLTVEFGDDVSDPKQGVSVANNFAADGVKFVIGHYNSGVTIPASEVYQENGILEITPASTNPTVT